MAEELGDVLSTGLIAGEGMGGVVTAVFTVVKIDGGLYGSAVVCPAVQFCGEFLIVLLVDFVV